MPTTIQDEYDYVVQCVETIREKIDTLSNKPGPIDVGRLADQVDYLARTVIMLARLQQRSIK
jgi:hemerythrin-like domain-containing protein